MEELNNHLELIDIGKERYKKRQKVDSKKDGGFLDDQIQDALDQWTVTAPPQDYTAYFADP